MADIPINSDSTDIPAVNFAQQGSDPTAPAASRWLLFFKSTGLWAITNGASAFRLAKHLMTAAGDLTIGGASGIETVLPKGSALDVLRVKGDGSTLEWAAPAAGGYTQGARVYRTTNQSIDNNSEQAISFDAETYDTDGIHEGVTNPTRLTCQTTGKYIVVGNVRWANNGTGERDLAIRVDGTTAVASENRPGQGSQVSIQCISTLVDLTAGQYVELTGYQNSGGGLNVLYVAGNSPTFSMQRVG